METTGCPKISITTNQRRVNIPEELRSHLHRGGSLKSRIPLGRHCVHDPLVSQLVTCKWLRRIRVALTSQEGSKCFKMNLSTTHTHCRGSCKRSHKALVYSSGPAASGSSTAQPEWLSPSYLRIHLFIHSLRSLSYNRSITHSKAKSERFLNDQRPRSRR
jgi:hypothetical protein